MISDLPCRGIKGTTGTQASFLELFRGDHEKVKRLNEEVCADMGFSKWVIVSGQTYTRKIDYRILSVLSGLAQVLNGLHIMSIVFILFHTVPLTRCLFSLFSFYVTLSSSFISTSNNPIQ